MPTLLTQTEFAARHGVGKPAVTAWKKKGLLVWVDDPERPGKRKIDAEKSDLLVRAVIDQTRGRPRSADQKAADAAEVQAQPASAARTAPALNPAEQARLDEVLERTRSRRIDNERRLGGLVELAEYERRAGDLGRRAREGVHAIIRQQAERLAAEAEPRQIIAVLGEAVDGLFNRLADEIEAEATREREVDAELEPLAVEDDDEGEGA